MSGRQGSPLYSMTAPPYLRQLVLDVTHPTAEGNNTSFSAPSLKSPCTLQCTEASPWEPWTEMRDAN
jgi:hypothetical protein